MLPWRIFNTAWVGIIFSSHYWAVMPHTVLYTVHTWNGAYCDWDTEYRQFSNTGQTFEMYHRRKKIPSWCHRREHKNHRGPIKIRCKLIFEHSYTLIYRDPLCTVEMLSDIIICEWVWELIYEAEMLKQKLWTRTERCRLNFLFHRASLSVWAWTV